MIVLRNKEFAFWEKTVSGKNLNNSIKAIENIKKHWNDPQFITKTIPDTYCGIKIFKKVRVPYVKPAWG